MIGTMIVAALCLGVVLLAAEIVLGWISNEAAAKYRRFMRGAMRASIVAAAVIVVAVLAMSIFPPS